MIQPMLQRYRRVRRIPTFVQAPKGLSGRDATTSLRGAPAAPRPSAEAESPRGRSPASTGSPRRGRRGSTLRTIAEIRPRVRGTRHDDPEQLDAFFLQSVTRRAQLSDVSSAEWNRGEILGPEPPDVADVMPHLRSCVVAEGIIPIPSPGSKSPNAHPRSRCSLVDENQIVEAQYVDIVLAPASANEQVVVPNLQRLWWDIERDTSSLVPREFAEVDLRKQLLVDVDRCSTVRDGASPFPNNLEVQLQLRIRRDVVERERTLVIVAIRPDIEAWFGALQEVSVSCCEGRCQDRSYQRKDDPQPAF